MRAVLSFLLLVGFGQLCPAAAAQERPTPVSSPNMATSQTYITHVTVIDTETGEEAKDRTAHTATATMYDPVDVKYYSSGQ